ncbi:MAG: diguanylate cyclase [Verrucomicrobia bacterium]|nr:diguanylate cyclase [Verrucomicrobiota bacterium]
MIESATVGQESDVFEFSSIVLMVDDQKIVGEAMRRMLQAEKDIEFHYCSDTASAISRAESIKPTIILQDLVMPGVDGMSMIPQYRAHHATRDIPIIVLSSKEDPAVKRDAFSNGANDYLVKLPDPIELIARVRAHSRAFRSQQQLRLLQQKLEASNAVLRQLSSQDGLTGIANRQHFDEQLDREWRRCQRNGKQVSLVMIDVDGFKLYNDHYGHQAGDDCLRTVAQALKKTIMRPGDILARYGGEEFVVILPETDLPGAAAVAERLRDAVERLELHHEKSPCSDHVTISLGVACCSPTARMESITLVRHADRALYRAKKSGRNRAFLAEPLQGPPAELAA